MIRVPSIPLLLLAATLPSIARAGTVTFPAERIPTVSSSEGAGVYGATAVGDFDGDRIADAFLVRGNSLLHVNDIVIDGFPTVVTGGVNDAATLRGAILGHDACVTVGDDGLRLWYFDEGAAFEEDDNEDGLVTRLLDGDAWVDAVALHCGDLDGDGREDVVGLSADRLHLLTMLSTTSYPFVVAGPTRTLANAATAIALVDFDGDGDHDVAVASSTGVAIHPPLTTASATASPLPVYAYPVLTTYRVPGDGDRLVALSADVPNVGQFVLVATPLAVETSLQLPPNSALVSVAALDADLDGDLDLALNSRADRDVLVFLQDPSESPPFSATDVNRSWVVVPGDALSGPDPGRAARLAAVDVDGDGDVDLVHGDDVTSSVTLLRNLVEDHAELQPEIQFQLESLGTAGLRLRAVVAPNGDADPTSTHVELVVFRQPDPAEPAEPDAIIHQRTPIQTTVGAVVGFTLPESAGGFDTRYWLSARYVRVSSGKVAAGGPPAVFLLDLGQELLAQVAGFPILVNGAIPQPGGAKGVFARPTAKPTQATVVQPL